MKTVDFKVFRAAADLPNGRVAALRVPGGGTLSRKEIDDYTPFVEDLRRQGPRLHQGERRAEGERGGPAVADRQVPAASPCCARSSTRTGAQAATSSSSAPTGRRSSTTRSARCARRSATSAASPTAGWKPLWVVDFPMFEYDDETGRRGRRATIRSPRRRTATRQLFVTDPGTRDRQGLRRRAERLGDRRRIGADPSPRGAGEGVRGARHLAGGPAEEVRLPARRAALRRAAARRHRVRPRPHRRR